MVAIDASRQFSELADPAPGDGKPSVHKSISTRKRFFLPLKWRSIALFVAVGLAPAGVVGYLLTGANTEAVTIAERQRQIAVAGELTARSLQKVAGSIDDTRAVAAAIISAAQNAGTADNADPWAGIRSILASRRSIRAARFEVPSVAFDTVIRIDEHEPPPSSTAALRSLADEREAAFVVQPDGSSVVIVRVEPMREGGHVGYVSALVDLSSLDTTVAELVGSHFDDERVSVIVVDAARRVVSRYNVGGLERGSDASGLPIWALMPEGASSEEQFGIVSTISINGDSNVANILSVPDTGWIVAIWRPESVAYEVLFKLRRNILIAGIAALVMAIGIGWLVGRAVAKPILRIADQTKWIGKRRWDEVRVDTDRGDEIGQLAASIKLMAMDLKASEIEIEHQSKLRSDLSRFLSKELVDAIVEGRHPLSLGGRRAEVSVLFADVVAFTPLAESRPAEEVVKLLNELFSMLSEIVFRHHGMVDKFIGDCVMAVWGAAQHQSDHALRAVAAADDMMRFLETAASRWREAYDVEVRLGVGINSGQVLVGNIGSSKRMEFTVIGDVVNVASRLETIARPNQVLMTASTREAVGEDFEVLSLGFLDITGRKERMEVFELYQGG